MNQEPINKPPKRIPLHLRMWLTPDCHVELTLRGKITPAAMERLTAILALTPESEEGEDLQEATDG